MTTSSKLVLILRMSSRYLLSKRSGGSRLINFVSFFGIVLGFTLLIVVLSVLNGTRDAIDEDFFRVYPHAIARVHSQSDPLLAAIRALPGVASIEPFVDLYGLLSAKQHVNITEPGISIYGFDPNSSNRTFRQMHAVIEPEQDLPKAGLDVHVANVYGLSLGDTFSITVPLVTPFGINSKTVSFRYARPLWLGERVQISKLMYVQIPDLLASGIVSETQVHHRITLEDPSQAPKLFRQYPEVVTWAEHYGSFFQALVMEKTILFILLLFVVGLVTMNVISGQAMLINRKSSDIAILQTMGAGLHWISVVFVFQGAIIVFGGVVVGTISGCVVANYAHHIMQWFPTGGHGVSLNFDTAIVTAQDLVWTTVAALLIGLVAILRPLNLVFKKDPIESLSRMV